jgi:threonine/homoserine/homoserine lactone efflux protein
MWIYILSGLMFGFTAAVTPGPFQAYSIAHTLRHGLRSSLPLAFVPLCSDLPIIALVVLLLNGLPDSFILILRLVGGAYLIYLAYGALRSALTLPPTLEQTAGAAPGFFKAVLVNFLNPNPYLFWGLITGPLLLTGWKESPSYGIAMLVSFYLMMTIVVTGILFAVGFAARFNSVRRGLILVSAVGLAAFGLYQLWMGIGFILASHASA